jgi:hypothetical protein
MYGDLAADLAADAAPESVILFSDRLAQAAVAGSCNRCETPNQQLDADISDMRFVRYRLQGLSHRVVLQEEVYCEARPQQALNGHGDQFLCDR